jgi:predicted dehydrogenase
VRPRVLIVGAGSIGRRHVAALARLDVDIAVVRRSAKTARSAAGELGMPAFADLHAALAWRPDAAIVATPTSEHVAGAGWALDHGLHVLVEKPLSSSAAGVERLIETAERRGRILAVGCNLRFHPGLEAIKEAIDRGDVGRLLAVRAEVGQYLPDWHPGTDFHAGYAARADLGGGAALTLIHELDYVQWIAGPVRASTGVRARLALGLEVDDAAELVVEHVGGTLSSVHMDFIDRVYNRRSRWIGEDASIEWRWDGPAVLERPGCRQVLWEDERFDIDITYWKQATDFVEAIAEGRPPRTTGREAADTLKIILATRVMSWPTGGPAGPAS